MGEFESFLRERGEQSYEMLDQATQRDVSLAHQCQDSEVLSLKLSIIGSASFF